MGFEPTTTGATIQRFFQIIPKKIWGWKPCRWSLCLGCAYLVNIPLGAANVLSRFCLIHNTIARVHAVRFMAQNLLRDIPRYACPVHIPRCRPAEVMKEPFHRCLRLLTGRLPRFVKRFDRMTAPCSHIPTASERAMEYSWGILPSHCMPTLDNLGKLSL